MILSIYQHDYPWYNIAHYNITTSNHFMHKTIPHINMLNPLVKIFVFSKKDGILTITINYRYLQVFTISPINPFNHIVFIHTSVMAMFSTSIVDNATVFCKVAFHLIAQPSIVNTYPISDILLSRSIA